MTNKSKTDGGWGIDLPPQPRTGVKEAYQQPHLIVYGNIREITKAVGMKGSKDGVLDLKSQ